MKAGDFTEQAEDYHRARPSYPSALLDALIFDAGIQPGDVVAEIGAGTGLLTQLLFDRDLRVTAVEPNAKMRALAEPRTGVEWRDGTFDATGLPDSTFAWVGAAQAFHWADPKTALPEMRRILRTGGAFTVLWNNRDNERSEILQATNAIIKRRIPEFDPTYHDGRWGEVLTSTGDFSDVIYRRMSHTVVMSASRYLELWRSHNLLNVTAGPERFASFLVELENYLQRQSIEVINVPYFCEAWTAR